MDHDRLQTLVRELRGPGLSERAIPVVLRRWADGKGDGYNSGWRAWAQYCEGRGISPAHPPRGAVDVADWLSSIVEAGGKFSRFDNFRSSVCVFLDLLSGSVARMADAPLVKTVSRAAATDMSRAPRYSSVSTLVWGGTCFAPGVRRQPYLRIGYWRRRSPFS